MVVNRRRTARRTAVALLVCLTAAAPVLGTGAPSRALAATNDLPARSYVLNPTNNSVSVVSTSTGAVTKTISGLPASPVRGAVTTDGRRLFVVSPTANKVSVVDTTANTLTTTTTVGTTPVDLAVTLSNNRVYVANRSSNSLSVLNASTGAVVSTITKACGPSAPAGTKPTTLALLGDGSVMFVGCDNGGTGTLVVRDPSDGGYLYTKTLDGVPTVMAAGPGFSAAMFIGYRTSGGAGGIDAYSASSAAFYDSVSYSNPVDGIAPTPDGSRLLVTTSGSGTLRSVNGSLDTVASITLTSDTHSVAMSPDGATVLVTHHNASTMSLVTISGDTLTLRKTVSGLPGAIGVVAEPAVPTAAFTVSSSVPGTPTTFDASESFDTAGHIATYDWDFGDGDTASVTTPTTTHTYEYGGHTATLTVTDDAGYSDTIVYAGHSPYGGGEATVEHPVPFANPRHDVVYVPSYGGLHVADPITLKPLGTIELDGEPGWVAVTPDGRWVVKTRTGSSDHLVTIVDTTTNFVTKTLSLAALGGTPSPQGVAIAPDGKTAYVADEGQDAIQLVSLPSGTVTGHITLSLSPYALAYATPLPVPNSDLLVVVGHSATGAPKLAVVSLALKRTLLTVTLSGSPQDVAIAPASTTAYVSTDEATVDVVNILTGQLRSVALTGSSYGVAVRANGSEIFATQQGRDYGLTYFGPNASAPVGVAPTGYGPWGVALTTNAMRAITVNNGDNSLTVITTRTHALVGYIDLDPLDSDDPTSIAVAPPVVNPPPVVPPAGVPPVNPPPPPGTPPPSTTPHLPTTGGPLTALGIAAVLLLAAGAAARRWVI